MFLSPHLLRLATDARLVALVRERHPAAFEAVYSRHHRAILSFCRHMLGDPQEAEDAVQQTFLAAYSDLIASDKPIHLRAWLFTIARNRCNSLLRRRREQPTSELEDVVTEGLASQVQRRQDLRDLVVDLRRLPDDQRAALVLAELDALSHEEIASALGVPREKVKALVFQARESLVASRTARETDCAEIREQLSTQRGGALRRANLRRHLRECAGCREFRREIERQRRQLAVLLPVAPTVALKEGVLGATIGAGTVAGAGTGGLMISTALKSGLAKGALGALLAGAGAATTIVATHGLQRPTSHPARHRPVTAPAPSSARAQATAATDPHRFVSDRRRASEPRGAVTATGGAVVLRRGVGPAGSYVRRGATRPFAAGRSVPKALPGGRRPAHRKRPSAPAVPTPAQSAPAASPAVFPKAPVTIPTSGPIVHSGSHTGSSTLSPQRGGGDTGSGVPLQMHSGSGTTAGGVTRGQTTSGTPSGTVGAGTTGTTAHPSTSTASPQTGTAPQTGSASGSGSSRTADGPPKTGPAAG